MNYTTRKTLTIWIAAILISVLFHFSVGAVCYGTMQKGNDYSAPPAALMLTFAIEPEQPNIVDDSSQIATTTPASQTNEDTIDKDEAKDEKQDVTPSLSKPIENKEITENEKNTKPDIEKEKKQQKPKKVSKPKKTSKIEDLKNTLQKAKTQQVTTNTKQKYAGNTNNLLSPSNGTSTKHWLAKVQSHLERQRNFLSKERSNKTKGTVMLHITVAANGTIQVAQLKSSSGSAELDKLALDVVKRSSPLPIPPIENIGQKISVPLVFR